jgi:hypothetical protein
MSKCAASAFFFIKQKTVITTLISKDGKSDIVKKVGGNLEPKALYR